MSDRDIGSRRCALMNDAWQYRERASKETGGIAPVRWDCGRGHRWDDALDHAQNVRCMNCATQRREGETNRARGIAEVRGGALLSREVVSAATPLVWQCAYGHVWSADVDAAERRWCAECARTVFARYR